MFPDINVNATLNGNDPAFWDAFMRDPVFRRVWDMYLQGCWDLPTALFNAYLYRREEADFLRKAHEQLRMVAVAPITYPGLIK